MLAFFGSVSVKLIALAVLIVGNFFIWSSVARAERSAVLTVAFFDVGQGDSIYIESPTGKQVLIDGGPDRAVLRSLGSVMPLYDRSIDIVLATHPDADHIGGLPDVLRAYTVGAIVTNGASSDTATFDAFDQLKRREPGATIVSVRRGMNIELGGGVVLSILFPDRSMAGAESNDGSIIARLSYGTVSFLFTGDAPKAVESYLVTLDGASLDVDVLKVGHHGSKTSTTEQLVTAASPRYAVISAGKDNRYGHPNRTVLDTLTKQGVEIIGTYDVGTILFTSDGRSLWKN